MIRIQTWTEADHAVGHMQTPALRQALQAHVDRLREFDGYDLADLADLVIVEEADTLDEIEHALGLHLVNPDTGTFASDPELVTLHDSWVEVVWVLSDDGYGLVLFADTTSRTAPELITACHNAVG